MSAEFESQADSPTLDVNLDNVCRLIQLARIFHAQEAVVIPEEPGNPSDDWPTQILAAHHDDQSLNEFRSIIDDLDRNQQVEVVALLWMGRGDYDRQDWHALLSDADAEWTDYTADYLMAHPMLSDQLTEGLDILGYHCD
ncbi:DUF3775 domain-containing protein [Natronospira bacteriovora]|uniref:DUF3775 domain-containing protein n=1 Tax=Natronospira bacteriovora TaxID=3069753 RepID=A0ABU0W4Y2_9GAMM|nr:DUF3775 domain-containing protein [Natronospira sp. AB-CW4]MDQ2069051.1 DUF3775 domain-containing protein [Natronospira sp. AB-CW4]